MNSLATLLLPVDFSERSAGAARYARTLAHQLGSEIVLLHVLPRGFYEFASVDAGVPVCADLLESEGPQVEKELCEFANEELEGCRIRAVCRQGVASECIAEVAHAEKAGMILMPTHGYGPFRRLILGSNTAKVLHDAQCPVWTGVHIAGHQPGDAPLRRILCAIDLGPESCATIKQAAFLQSTFHAELIILHVTAAPDQEQYAKVIEEQIGRLKDKYPALTQILIRQGEPAAAICESAANTAADLLVIGRGSAGPVRGRLRSNAYTIIRESPCPVLSV